MASQYIDLPFGGTTNRVAYTPTFTGFGTASNINIMSSRVGPYLIIMGNFTCGTVTATEARMTLGFNGVNANVTSASNLPTVSIVGSGGTIVFLIEPSKTYITFGTLNTTPPPAKKNGNVLISSNTIITVSVMVPIDGWGA